MLIFGIFFLFVTGIVYMHVDMSISKSSASYLAKLQWDEVGFCLVFSFKIIYNKKTVIILCLVLGASSNSADQKYHHPMPRDT